MNALVDFHCHIDLYPDPPSLIAECDRLGIRTLAVTTTPKAWPQNKKWTEFSTHVRPALGFHPQVAAEREHELPLFEEYLPEARYIGEVGLDAGPRHYQSLDSQLRVFRRVLELCALHPGRIISVHSVRSASRVLDALKELLPTERGTVVLHWFSGSKSEASRAVDLGCYFSINRAMVEGKRCDLIKTLPRDRLLTETDGPFTNLGARPAKPADIPVTLIGLASLMGIGIDELSHQVNLNLQALVIER
tara:strand:+ start:4465 stop:5208 length:744 start_codon:yes stop_codon:yes gene_type:complete